MLAAWRDMAVAGQLAGDIAERIGATVDVAVQPSRQIDQLGIALGGPDCQWKGGEYERIEAKNRAALKAAEQAEIEASGYFTEPGWREVVSPDGVLCFVIRFAPSQKRARQDLLPPMPDDLSIPEFLDRRSRKSPAMRLAAPHPWPPTGLRRSSAPEERSLEFPQVRNPSRARVG
jgi:hypothetical protein